MWTATEWQPEGERSALSSFGWCQEEKSSTQDGVQLSPSHRLMDKEAEVNDPLPVWLALLHGLELQEGDEGPPCPSLGYPEATWEEEAVALFVGPSLFSTDLVWSVYMGRFMLQGQPNLKSILGCCLLCSGQLCDAASCWLAAGSGSPSSLWIVLWNT